MNTLPQKKPPTADKQVCPHIGRYGLVSKTTGEIVQLPCNRYACEVCGKRKAYKLQKALELRFGIYDYVRLWTFTFRTTIFANPHHAIARSGEIWRRFINNVRRDKNLSKKQRNFQYVRLIEFTKRDYPHYHCLINIYLPQEILMYHWHNAIRVVMRIRGDHGSVNAKGIRTCKQGARYVVKYVLKTAQSFEKTLAKYYDYKRCKLKLYTKSGEMKLFYPKSPIDDWIFVILGSSPAMTPLIYKDYAQLPQKMADYFDYLPPPDENYEFQPSGVDFDFTFEDIQELNSLKHLFFN